MTLALPFLQIQRSALSYLVVVVGVLVWGVVGIPLDCKIPLGIEKNPASPILGVVLTVVSFVVVILQVLMMMKMIVCR